MKKIHWWIPEIGTKEHEYVKEALEKSYPNEGYITKEFEKQVATRVNARYAVSTTSGTSALFLSLKAAGIGHGDEVIVPVITFIASANAVKMAGAQPVFVDCNPDTANIAVEKIEAALTPRTKAIMPVHVSGRGCDMQAIRSLAQKHNLAVIEDAAEAFMSKHKGQYLGTWGDLGCFSFSPHKIITTGQGGMIVTNNEELYKKLILLKDHGRPFKGTGGDDTHHCVGYNFKLTNLQAGVGLGQLELLDERINKLKTTYLTYKKLLSNNPLVRLFDFNIEEEVPLWTDAQCSNRDALQTLLKEKQIDARNYWHPLHMQTPYKQPEQNYPESVALSKKALWLPSNFTLTQEDITYVANQINAFAQEQGSMACNKTTPLSYQL